MSICNLSPYKGSSGNRVGDFGESFDLRAIRIKRFRVIDLSLKSVTILAMNKSGSKKSLLDGYCFQGFRARSKIKGRFGDSSSLVVRLSRRQKKQFALCA